MAVIFPEWTNRIPRYLAIGGSVALVIAILACWYWGSPSFTDVGHTPRQPVLFSHRLHSGDVGVDCRYCHFTAEESAYAAIPPTSVCMNCHARVLPNSPRLALVRGSSETGRTIPWVRVHMLPDYAYVNHSAHLAQGVGCTECHGRVDQMEIMSQRHPLSMGWCLTCHRAPGPSIRPVTVAVTDMGWVATDDHDLLVSRTGREVAPPVQCSGCHH